MTIPFCYEYARDASAEFAKCSASIMARHREAMLCRDCEDCIQLGIVAMEWMDRWDVRVQELVIEHGEPEQFSNWTNDLAAMYRSMLAPSDRMLELTAWLESKGYTVERAADFRKHVEELRAIVKHLDVDHEEMSDPLRALRDDALDEYANGQTSEFV